MIARRSVLTVVVSLCVLAGGLLLCGASAFALSGRAFVSSFSAPSGPTGVAVDQETGNVFVVESEAGVIVAFGPEGGAPLGVPATTSGFITPTGEPIEVAVDNACWYHQPRLTGVACEAFDPSSGDLYVANPKGNAIEKLALNKLTDEYEIVNAFPFKEPNGVAVDHEGNVYVADYFEPSIPVFSPAGVEIGKIETQGSGHPLIAHPAFIAVGSLPGNVYVSNYERGTVQFAVNSKYEVQSEASLQPSGKAVTFDPSGNVLVDQESFVSEYSPSGALVGGFGETEPGSLKGSLGLAVNATTGRAYVSLEQDTTVNMYGPALKRPELATGPPSELGATSATLNGTVNPEGLPVTSCFFEYGTSASYEHTVPCEQSPGSGETAVPVTGKLTGLQPDKAYHYRVVASDENGAAHGADEQFVTPAPGVRAESVSDATAESVTFEATINPNGSSTTYYFQYGTSTGYGIDIPASPGALVGSEKDSVEINWHVQGLEAGTVYHYRVVAVNSFATTDGPDQTFTTQRLGGSSQMIDGRQWEMVSPPQKDGAAIGLGETSFVKASVGGDAISYSAKSPIEPNPHGSSNQDQVLSLRGPDGWTSQNIAPPHETATGPLVGQGEEYRFFSDDLSLGVMQLNGPLDPSISEEASEPTAFLRTDYLNGNVGEPCVSKCYHPLVTGCPPVGQVCSRSVEEHANIPAGTVFAGTGEGFNGPYFEGGTPDLSHVVLRSEVGLTAGTNGGLYEWSGGKLAFIGALDHSFQVISDDGSKVVFYGPPVEPGDPERLFMRDMSREETVLLGQGTFQVASSDGSRVLFIEGGDLHECDMAIEANKLSCSSSNLTSVGAGKEPAKVQGQILGASKDGSWVYFVAGGVLASGAAPGANNLYVRNGGVTKLVATLANDDNPDWATKLTRHTARVSQNGDWLAFMSDAQLTGYDNRDALSGQPDEEVYLYRASTGNLMCASCNPTGARPSGLEEATLPPGNPDDEFGDWPSGQWLAANIPGWTPSLGISGVVRYQSRYLSDSGRLFFNSNDALVPQDVNGTEDVYEYEPPNIGDCTTSSTNFGEHVGGCVGLISSGASAEESGFQEASETGGDVFFLTTSKLLTQDFDASRDVYDAHECGMGSPCFAVPPAAPPVCSTGDSCKAAPSPQPSIYGSPSSATFSGTGNLTVSGSSSGVASKTKPLSRAQKLAHALKACRKKREKQRAVCGRRAKARYGAKLSFKANAKKGGAR